MQSGSLRSPISVASMIHCYKLGGYNIVLDVSSGAVHSVDDVAFDAICLYETLSREEIKKRLKDKYSKLTDDDIAELLTDIEQLKLRGKLFSTDVFGGVAEQRRNTSLKALCLNVSHQCNMSCEYCFAGRGGYGGETGLMSFETGKQAIDFLVGNSNGRTNLDVDFFGGEPLLNWEVVKSVVGYAREIEQDSGKKFRFTLTTNGLLIDDDVISFTNREMSNIVLSLDGRPETNDALRKLPGGGGSYSEVLPKIRKLVDARRGKGYYIRSTFTRRNLDFVNDILHIADLGFAELSTEPVVARPGSPFELTMGDLESIKKQYETLAVEMLRRKKQGRGFRFYHFLLDLTGGPCIHKRIAGCGVGSEYLAVTPEGCLYPCHQFVGDERFLMGDIRRGVIIKQPHEEFRGCNIYSRGECRACWARLFCSGGCAASAFYASGSVKGVYELGCEMFRKRMECAIMMQADSLT